MLVTASRCLNTAFIVMPLNGHLLEVLLLVPRLQRDGVVFAAGANINLPAITAPRVRSCVTLCGGLHLWLVTAVHIHYE
jgi:hypothetical protein